jgi:hypothetical protein
MKYKYLNKVNFFGSINTVKNKGVLPMTIDVEFNLKEHTISVTHNVATDTAQATVNADVSQNQQTATNAEAKPTGQQNNTKSFSLEIPNDTLKLLNAAEKSALEHKKDDEKKPTAEAALSLLELRSKLEKIVNDYSNSDDFDFSRFYYQKVVPSLLMYMMDSVSHYATVIQLVSQFIIDVNKRVYSYQDRFNKCEAMYEFMGRVRLDDLNSNPQDFIIQLLSLAASKPFQNNSSGGVLVKSLAEQLTYSLRVSSDLELDVNKGERTAEGKSFVSFELSAKSSYTSLLFNPSPVPVSLTWMSEKGEIKNFDSVMVDKASQWPILEVLANFKKNEMIQQAVADLNLIKAWVSGVVDQKSVQVCDVLALKLFDEFKTNLKTECREAIKAIKNSSESSAQPKKGKKKSPRNQKNKSSNQVQAQQLAKKVNNHCANLRQSLESHGLLYGVNLLSKMTENKKQKEFAFV